MYVFENAYISIVGVHFQISIKGREQVKLLFCQRIHYPALSDTSAQIQVCVPHHHQLKSNATDKTIFADASILLGPMISYSTPYAEQRQSALARDFPSAEERRLTFGLSEKFCQIRRAVAKIAKRETKIERK